VAARSKARKRALDILFEAEMRRESPLSVLDSRMGEADPPVTAYAAELVRGVQAHREMIDGLLAEHSHGWSLDRMPAVDRNILRIGAYELLWETGVPDGVAISEAVVLARDLSTDASPAFINGLLARLLEIRPSLIAETAGDVAETAGDVAETAGDVAETAGDVAETPDDVAETADDVNR
jgi:transcription antitermination protein NusB